MCGLPMTATDSEYEVIPFGIYRVSLKSIEEVAKKPEWLNQNTNPNITEDTYQWIWKFAIMGGDYEGFEIRGYTARTIGRSRTTGKPYKALAWVEALIGKELSAEAIDSDQLVGRECFAKIDDKKKNGEPGNPIIGLDPLNSGLQTSTLPPRQEPVTNGHQAPSLTQELEAPAPVPTENPGEALGYPRRIAAARMALKKAGILDEDMDHRQAKIVGHPGKFRELETADKKLVVDWFEAWAEDWGAPNPEDRGQIYDLYGEMQF